MEIKEINALQNITEEIVNSYEINVRTVTSLIRQVIQKIKKFHREQVRMADKLKNILAKNRSLRRKDFDTMMAAIRIQQANREKEINQLIEDFCKDEEEAVAKLREILTGKSPCILEDFNHLKKKMLERPKERERKLSKTLKNFHRDQEELVAGFRKLLEKGPAVRIKDFKALIKAFHIEHMNDSSGVDEILEEFGKVKDEISQQWQKVMATVSKRRISSPLYEFQREQNKSERR